MLELENITVFTSDLVNSRRATMEIMILPVMSLVQTLIHPNPA